ncbi:MGH1-like glycoside hydrolase domain-containing protein [Promicromonospora kroppenstedtii]|uniref:MGH1-like glycoside hydrolase domain-containing protein n=1 Tax=Promicromonospora kroppenstedtii TaxID=440482 RepID=A0ABW7XIP1_9MICO
MYKDFEEDAADAAIRVLNSNWTGRHTVPATGLYPHQWSWDSAFVAIGTRHHAPARARAELVTLFDAQWADGRVPQIVYDVGRDDDYAPGAGFWGAATSGLVQPPVHAWAAWLVHCADPAGSAREGFLARLYPRLTRWHGYLHGPRRGGVGLPVTKHPWETGTDNSPLWDAALERVPPRSRTPVRRPDLRHAGTGERPGSRDYRRYYGLAETYRDAGCADDAPIGFGMVCPLFSTLLAVSELALGRIAATLPDAGRGPGVDVGGAAHRVPGAHEAAAARVAVAMDEHLWDENLGLYVALDDTTGRTVRRATVNGLAPLLLAGVSTRTGASTTTGATADRRAGTAAGGRAGLAPGRSERLLTTLAGPGFLGGGPYLPSTSRDDPAFDPALYWRGPAWFNTSWLLLRAVQALGQDEPTARLREHFAVAAPGKFPEYVDPDTGAGRGTHQFSWTAALTLDVLLSDESTVFPGPGR